MATKKRQGIDESKPKKEKKVTTTVAPTRNKFGSLIGSKHAAIDAALTDTPLTMREIIEKAGVEGKFFNHLNALVAKGHAVKMGTKYRLAKGREGNE